MRIIKEKTLKEILLQDKYKPAALSLKKWVNEIATSTFVNPSQLKEKFRNASILTDKRVVFNIKGNEYRLITDVEYKLQILFIVWFGTHTEYDKIDAKTISYEN